MQVFDGLDRYSSGWIRSLQGLQFLSGIGLLVLILTLTSSQEALAARDPFLSVLDAMLEPEAEPEAKDPFAILRFVGYVQPLTGGGKSIAAISQGGGNVALKHAGESFDVEGEDFLLKAASLAYIEVLHMPSKAIRRLPMETLDVQLLPPVTPTAPPSPPKETEPSSSEGKDSAEKPVSGEKTASKNDSQTQKAIDKVLSGVQP